MSVAVYIFSSSSIDKEIEILVVLWVNISRLANPWSLRKINSDSRGNDLSVIKSYERFVKLRSKSTPKLGTLWNCFLQNTESRKKQRKMWVNCKMYYSYSHDKQTSFTICLNFMSTKLRINLCLKRQSWVNITTQKETWIY